MQLQDNNSSREMSRRGSGKDSEPKMKVIKEVEEKYVHEDDEDEEEATSRMDSMTYKLHCLRKELQEMRQQDQQLARQLLTLRHEIHQLRVAKSCKEHSDIIEDVAQAFEDRDEFGELWSDLPPLPVIKPLRDLGLTKMNFSSRRFSLR